MNTTDQHPKKPRSATGLFALLAKVFVFDGTGAPKISAPWRSQILIPLFILATLASLTSATGTALAATPPESPITSAPAEVKGSTAVLQGLVNPLKLGVVGWFFEYKAGGVCTGGVTTPLEGPEETEMRPVAVGIAGLTQETTYTVCLVAENEAKERTAGAPVTFTTITPEPPAGLEAEPVAARTATLHGVLNPKHAGEAGSYEFVYRQSETECMGGEPGPQEEKSTAEEAATGAEGQVAMPAQVTGLEPNLPYTFCLRAKNEAGEEALSAPVTFTTLAEAPKIAGESVSAVEAAAATLEAEIVPEGAATTYHFVYVEAAKYRPDCAECEDEPANAYALGAGTPESESIGADDVAHAAEARVMGLAPGTTYHYSVVATNAESPAGGTPGPDKTFTTNPAPSTATTGSCPNEQLRAEQPFGLTLPDCRAYEMVSPVVTGGQDATSPSVSSRPRAAVSGAAITYASRGSFEEPAGASVENQYLSRREPEQDRWSTRAITPLHDPAKGESSASYEATAFTPELTAGIAATNDSLTGPGAAGEFRLYRADLESGAYQFVAGEENTYPVGASSDLSHVVFGTAGEISEWANGVVMPVNVMNDGVQPTASVGAVPPRPGQEDVWHAVSSDGSRVYFSTPASEEEPGPSHLYLRVNAEQKQSEMKGEECLEPALACTIEIGAGGARYWGASADGSKVFYTEGEDLYEYSLPLGQVTGGQRTAITTGGEVQGVVQVSEEGSHVYFVADGALAARASKQQCRAETGTEQTGAEPKQDNLGCNLYLYHDGVTTFIATLAAGDEPVWEYGTTGESGPAINAAVVSPSGSYLAFLSEKSLTGYDNQPAPGANCTREKDNFGGSHENETGVCNELYLYDAGSGGAGSLTCASCNPTGARPAGPASLGPLADSHAFAQYRARNLLEDGTLFFDSFDALVPHASDGRQNVYEYEGGVVHAISNVAGGYESAFMDTGGSQTDGEEDGANVFFASSDRLLPQDQSDNVVVWDARVDGGFPVTAAAPSCDNADSCKPPPSAQPPSFAPTGSATFNGLGNFPSPAPPAPPKKTTIKKTVKCKKGLVKNKKGKCVPKKKKKAKKAKKSAKTNRRTGR